MQYKCLNLKLVFYFILRTFSSKLCNNKAELLKICRSLSDEVSKELIGDGLEVERFIILFAFLVFSN